MTTAGRSAFPRRIPSPVGDVALLSRARGSRSRWALALAGLALLAVGIVCGVVLGNVPLAPADTIAILAHRLLGWPVAVTWAPSAETIVMDLRLPRVITAVCVGAGLAVAGTTLQGLLRNPLADPYVLGSSSGAALGAAIALLIPVRVALVGLGLLHALAFLGSLLAVTLVYRLSRASTLGSLTGLLLTGYAVASLLAAGLALAMYLSGEHLRAIFAYLLGSLATASWPEVGVGLPLIAVGSALILWRARALDGMLLGDDAAAHLGLDVRRERRILLALSSLVTAAAVAMTGLIGFVGLVVPHLVRLATGPGARAVLPLSALFGAVLLVFADLIARIPGEVPVGLVTALIGAPFFLFLLRRVRTGYEL